MDHLQSLRTQLLQGIEGASNLETLEEVRIHALGRQGELTQLLKGLGALPSDQRKVQGQAVNALRQEVEKNLSERRENLAQAGLEKRLAEESIDVTLPVRGERSEGFVHPLSQTMHEMISILGSLGFEVAEGPDVESDSHNFTALNFPEEHPARQDHDTFYMKSKDEAGNRYVMRTHTSPVQVRTMLENKPPIAIVAPGRVYRSDSDQTHTPVFHQIEGLWIAEDVHMGHLKGVLLEFCRRFFGVPDLELRFRPSYFPFTEPSAEVDVGCDRSGKRLKLGGTKDWLEVLGCGMVHPNVLRNCGVDPEKYQGFAFGMGVERFAMLKYGIPDLRAFYETDLRWLRHYGFGIAKAFAGKGL
ncbi:MAG: phenylalanine--tRNA ligase subunit alpha [bacterium]|nr:phenylalanine--tRNA ligase subunit alpha [bacterium]